MSSTSRSTVSAEQDLLLIGPDDLIVPLTAGLHYSRHDPYAVSMSLNAGRNEPVEWRLSRDLLAAALHAREGIGDVRAWPSPAPAAPAQSAGPREKILNIELGPPDGYARFEASATEIETFLARTYELVPDGQEPAFLNLDAELTELLSQA
jgi:Streptomyces sporulation and cell division protein, SsgA